MARSIPGSKEPAACQARIAATQIESQGQKGGNDGVTVVQPYQSRPCGLIEEIMFRLVPFDVHLTMTGANPCNGILVVTEEQARELLKEAKACVAAFDALKKDEALTNGHG